MKEEMLKPEVLEKYFCCLWFIVWRRRKDKRMCLEMEINGRASAVKADVEVVIRVKRHTRLLDDIQEHGRGGLFRNADPMILQLLLSCKFELIMS